MVHLGMTRLPPGSLFFKHVPARVRSGPRRPPPQSVCGGRGHTGRFCQELSPLSARFADRAGCFSSSAEGWVRALLRRAPPSFSEGSLTSSLSWLRLGEDLAEDGQLAPNIVRNRVRLVLRTPEGPGLGLVNKASGRQTSALQGKGGPHCLESWAASRANEPPVTGGM